MLMSAIDLLFKIVFKIKTSKLNEMVSWVLFSHKQQILTRDFLCLVERRSMDYLSSSVSSIRPSSDGPWANFQCLCIYQICNWHTDLHLWSIIVRKFNSFCWQKQTFSLLPGSLSPLVTESVKRSAISTSSLLDSMQTYILLSTYLA